ncbi:carbohydrate ABC transporter permease [Litorisediminicola beolgyonensis]|uniref:Carbohydrate ABC transporter permease n=1 Tax=Litorisediminicola beolgyonensis TaxID=1173614 RepID=A0ABW3ZF45_9RHOB
MSTTWTFLTRKAGGRRANWLDWLTYAYLLFGLLIIAGPVAWLALNSLKTQGQLEAQNLSLLPMSYARVARASVETPEGKRIFIIDGLPDWALNWPELSDEERARHDPWALLAGTDADTRDALRAHLGLLSDDARALIDREGLPDWLLRYPTMGPEAQAARDLDAALAPLAPDERRLLSQFLGLPGFAPPRLVSQIRVTAPDPDTGAPTGFAVPAIRPGSEVTPARYVDNRIEGVVRLPTESLTADRYLSPSWSNYSEPLSGTAYGVSVNFATCITNSVLVTVIATVLTLLINSMAAFALAKYRFRGDWLFFLAILATLMVPPTITLVGIFKAIHATGLSGSIWGVIIPGAATPTGVFMLRQYMLSLPDELLEAARMDAASEWKVYWRIVLPLTLPALAALGILSVIWRWNDLILPLVAIATTKEAYTIQLCLLEFRGQHLSQEHYRLAMTMLSLIPSTLVFVFLQRHITAGIANTGLK